jgi:WD40 repeat protein
MRPATYLLAIVVLVAHSTSVCAMTRSKKAFSPDGSRAVVSDANGTSSLQDTATGNPIAILHDPRRIPFTPVPQGVHLPERQRALLNVCVGSFSPDGKLLATWRSGSNIILRNPRDGRKLLSLVGEPIQDHHEPMLLKFSSDSRLLVAVTRQPAGKRQNTDFIEVWEVPTLKEFLHVRSSEFREFKQVTLSPDKRTIMAVEGWPRGVEGPGVKRLVKLWAIERGDELVTLKGHSAAFSPDGNLLIVTNPGHPDTLWDIRTGKMHFLDKKRNPVQQQLK